MNDFIKQVLAEAPEAREELLKSHAYSIDEMVYSRTLTDEELGKVKDDYVQNNIKLHTFKEQLDNIKEDYKQKMKPLELLGREKIVQLKSRTIDEEGEVFAIDDQEQKIMYFVNKYGEVISSRPLLPDERQTSILKMAANEE